MVPGSPPLPFPDLLHPVPVTRIDVEVNEDSLWAGGRQAILLATAKVYVGIDLKQLSGDLCYDCQNCFGAPHLAYLDVLAIRSPVPRSPKKK